MPRYLYPLEGDAYDEARFLLYDNATRSVWGELRLTREKNPDFLVIEARQGRDKDRNPWKPIMKLGGMEGKLTQATFGLRGGFNHPIPGKEAE